jgi:hypothetical protein
MGEIALERAGVGHVGADSLFEGTVKQLILRGPAQIDRGPAGAGTPSDCFEAEASPASISLES